MGHTSLEASTNDWLDVRLGVLFSTTQRRPRCGTELGTEICHALRKVVAVLV